MAPSDRELRAVRFATLEDAGMRLKPFERKLLDRVEEQVGSLQRFPIDLMEMFLSRHLHYAARFRLTIFLLANRCPPTLVAEWYTQRGMLNDKSAVDHIISILKAHMGGELEAKNITAYVMDATLSNGDPAPPAMRNLPVYTPSFAYDWQHQHYWQEAIQTLKMPSPPPVVRLSRITAAEVLQIHNRAYSSPGKQKK